MSGKMKNWKSRGGRLLDSPAIASFTSLDRQLIAKEAREIREREARLASLPPPALEPKKETVEDFLARGGKVNSEPVYPRLEFKDVGRLSAGQVIRFTDRERRGGILEATILALSRNGGIKVQDRDEAGRKHWVHYREVIKSEEKEQE